MYVIYAGYRYGWGPTIVGLTLTLVGFSNIAVQGGLVRPFISRFGERSALSIGLLAGMAGYLVWGLANDGTAFAAGIFVFAPIGLAGPALQSLMTRHVKPSEQGQLQGANSSIQGLTSVMGPVLFTLVFALFIGPAAPASLPGAPFLLAAALMMASVALSVLVARRARKEVTALRESTSNPAWVGQVEDIIRCP